MKTKTKKWRWALLTLLTLSLAHPLTLSAQVNVTKKGITPPRNLWNYDHTQTWSKYGQMLGVKRYSSTLGDTLVGYLPVFYLGDSTLKVGAYTVVHTGNLSGYLSAAETDPTVAAYTKTLTSASVLLAQIETVDGSGSLLDADLLDGQSGAYYLAFANFTGTAALTTQVSGVLPVANGGTNLSSYTIGDLPYASGTTALSKLAIGTAGQLLRVNAGATAPEWYTHSFLTANQTITLSGDVTGSGSTAITTTIATGAVTSAKILDGTIAAVDLGQMSATSGQVMQWNGSAWVATTPSAGTPGGSNTHVQYNNAGAFGGSANFTFDGTNVSIATTLRVADGSAALPSYTFTNDLDVGLYRPTTNTLAFSTNGIEAARINPSNLFMIATTSSSGSKLSVGTDGGYNGGLFVTAYNNRVVNFGNVLEIVTNGSPGWVGQGISVAGASRKIQFIAAYNNTTDNELFELMASSSASAFGTPTSGGKIFYKVGTNLNFAPTSGTATYTAMKVVSNINQTGSSSGAIYGIDYDPTLTAVLGSHYGLLIREGLTGLGTATPTERLDVNGNIRFSGALMPNNLPGTSGQYLVSGGAGAPPTWATGVGGSGVANRIAYWSGTSAITSDADLTFDGTTAAFANPVNFSAGSASLPSLVPTGDTNNGWWFPTGDVQAWSTAGIERMRLDNNGFGVGGAPMSGITVRGAGNTAFTAGNSALTWVNTSSGLSMTMTLSNSTQLRIFDNSSNILAQWTNGGAFAGNVVDNTSAAYTLAILSGATFLSFNSTNSAEVLTLGSTSTGSTVNTAAPFMTAQYTATAASALTAQNGMIIYVTNTNGTFTSIGYWARENGVWVKH